MIPPALTKPETNPAWDALSPEEKRRAHARESLQGRLQMIEAGMLALDSQLQALGISPEKYRGKLEEILKEAHRAYDEKAGT